MLNRRKAFIVRYGNGLASRSADSNKTITGYCVSIRQIYQTQSLKPTTISCT